MEEEVTVSNTEINRVPIRNVLAEMPVSRDASSTLEFQHVVDHYTNIMHSALNSDSSTSPDELVIQQRGRRKIPIVFSPDIDTIKQSNQEPISEVDSSNLNKSSFILRSMARKRLLLNDPQELSSPEQNKFESLNITQPCIETVFVLSEDNCLLSALKTLTVDQLIGIIGQIVTKHPNVEKLQELLASEKEIRTNFPMADLKPLEQRINYLRHNIYKALPNSRLISKTNSTAYNRVLTHVLNFKKCVINQGKLLVESNQWSVVVNYVFMAWKHVRKTPIWDNPSQNASRRQCFKSLSAQCMTALKHMKESLDQDTCEYYKNKLKSLANDGVEDIELCLKFLEN